MSMVRAVLLLHWLHLIAGAHDYKCEEKSAGLKECCLIADTFNTWVTVTCSDQHLDINTTDNIDEHLNGTHLPPLNEAWVNCTNQSEPLSTSMLVDIKLSDNYITSLPDGYFGNVTTEQLTIAGSSLNDTTKIGLFHGDNCSEMLLAIVQKLRAEKTNFTKVLNNSFCGLEYLIELQLTHSPIIELEIDAFINLMYLQILDLKNNNISNLPIGVFTNQNYTLLQLDMSNNQLDGQSMSGLKDLQQLEILNLDGNRIEFLSNDVFIEMKQLRNLKIGHNLLKHLHRELKFLKNLDSLDVNTNYISAIVLDCLTLPNLKILDIQNNPIAIEDIQTSSRLLNVTHINFSNITLPGIPRFLSKATKIRSIQLTNKNIDRIKVGAFDAGENIDLIDLSYNRITDITKKFRKCTVKQLYLDHNRIKTFEFSDFSSQLTVLSMTHNYIHTINCPFDVPTVDSRWTLKTLNLSNNLFSELKDLSLPTSVANFYVKNNNISFISYSENYIQLSKNNRISLKEIHLENNVFKVVCTKFILPINQSLEYYFDGNPLLCSCENRWLSSTSNVKNVNLMKSIVADGHKLTCQYEFQRLGNQPKLINHLNNTNIYCSFNDECACDINRVTCKVQCPQQCQCHKPTHSNQIYIDCSSKSVNLPLTNSTKYNIDRNMYVYLDNNSIYKINISSLLGLSNTIELYLNWTGLSEIEDGSFDHLTVLNVLNLEHNNLRNISENIFKRLNSLTQLFLSHNKIRTVEPNAFPSQLQTLHLDNNQLVNYSVWQLDNMTNLVKLSLHANQWSCECNFKENFSNWLQNNSHIVEESDQVECVQLNVTQFQMPLDTTVVSYFYNAAAINGIAINHLSLLTWMLGMLFVCHVVV